MQRSNRFLRIFLLTAALAAVLLTGCGSSVPGAQKVKRPAVKSEELQFKGPTAGDTVATIETTAGKIQVVLYPSKAPQAVQNFIGLAESGFFNDTGFSRLEHGFCVQGGMNAEGFTSTIWNGTGYAPEWTDSLHHYSGALAAPVDDTGLCSGAFYFMQTLPDSVDDALAAQMTESGYRQEVIDAYKAGGGAPYLDYTDTVFGQVYEGMQVVDAIAQSGEAEEPILITSVTVSTYEK